MNFTLSSRVAALDKLTKHLHLLEHELPPPVEQTVNLTQVNTTEIYLDRAGLGSARPEVAAV